MNYKIESRVLNPTLYRLLQCRFGEGNVTVIREGQEIRWEVRRSDALLHGGKPRLSRAVFDPGEEYQLSCPFCSDTRNRLLINHRWGIPDRETGTLNLRLAHCFNETDCLSDYDRQKQLYEMVFTVGPRRGQITLRTGRPAEARTLKPIPMPGPIIRLDELIKTEPNHPAIVYLLHRGFDPVTLGKKYHVSYCIDSKFNLAAARLIIPVYRKGMRVGWQSRFIGDDVEGMSLKKAGVIKYWTMPSFPKSLAPYNYDRAIQYCTVVIVEGPADVWSTGRMAFGLFGTKLSAAMLETFVSDMQRRHGNQATVVVMLDPELPKQIKSRRRPIVHPITKLCQDLNPHFPNRVVPVFLPLGTDPGSLSRAVLHQQIRAAASMLGIKIDFSKKVKT